MKHPVTHLLLAVFLSSCIGSKQSFINTSDIPKFWAAYDQVIAISDTSKQVQMLDSLYLKAGSPGLHSMMEARRYTAEEYVYAINHYPNYWNTIRSKTQKAAGYASDINKGIKKLKEIYPELKPASIYFTVGAMRSGGTTLADRVLIGVEIALADKDVDVSEVKEDFPHLPSYFQSNEPDNNIVFNNIHEYVHTQQDTTVANSLLSRILIEGVAEFVAEKALNTASPTQSVIYGKENDKAIKETFVKEMFTQFEMMWFWGNPNVIFKKSDLGYYIGYAISKSYYDHAQDKEQAIKNMINLDYLNEQEVYQFIDDSKYFEKSIEEYKKEFELNRPKVVGIKEFNNNAEDLNPSINQMTIEFSKPMNTEVRNLQLGPMGRDHLLQITKFIGWSDDHTKLTFEINLKPKLHQQVVLTDLFRSEDGYLLEPYLIEVVTE